MLSVVFFYKLLYGFDEFFVLFSFVYIDEVDNNDIIDVL